VPPIGAPADRYKEIGRGEVVPRMPDYRQHTYRCTSINVPSIYIERERERESGGRRGGGNKGVQRGLVGELGEG
jgi:hypothetical protein